jgi:nucleotide-binding universal stress UspA family protein
MMTTAVSGIRAILAALDESTRARLVFTTAAQIAADLGAELCLVRVLAVPLDVPPAAHTHPDGLEKKVEQDARAELTDLMRDAPGVRFRPPVVVVGDPWRQILAVSKVLNVDLIVTGSHRYHGLDRVLGTVAAKVVNHADRNVLVVHDRP